MSYHLRITFTQRALVNPSTREISVSEFCAEVTMPTLGKSFVIPAKSLSLPALAVSRGGSSPIHVFTALGMMCEGSHAFDELATLIQVVEGQTELTYQILCQPGQPYATYHMDESACRTACMYLKSLQACQR